MDFIEFEKAERKRQNLGLWKLSKLSGVPWRTIDNWERLGTVPSVDKLENVLNALGYELKIVKTAKAGKEK